MDYQVSDIEGFVQTGGIDDNLRLYEKINMNTKDNHDYGYNRLEKQEGGGMKRFQEYALPAFIAVRSIEIHPFPAKVDDRSDVISDTMYEELLRKIDQAHPKSRDRSTKKLRLHLKQSTAKKHVN